MFFHTHLPLRLSLLLLLFFLLLPARILAADTADLDIQMTYGQSEARTMLKMINSFRQGEDAWSWKEGDKEILTYENLPALHYDYELEKAAMIRAAEIAFVFSHTRPTGKSCFTVGNIYTPQSIYGSVAGENIGTGYSSAYDVFVAWQETEEGYEGQAHRRTMLTPEYTAVGIGHVIYRGVHYWVQQYGSRSFTTPTPSINGLGPVTLTVPTSWITSLDLYLEGEERTSSLIYGRKCKLPAVRGTVTLGKDHVFTLMPKAPWISEDEEAATVICGWAYAHKAGKTTLHLDTAGEHLTLPLTIRPEDLSSFTLIIQEKQGKNQKEPPVLVQKGNLTLQEGVDYTVTYVPSYRPNYINVVVQGEGNYAGTLQKIFALSIPAITRPAQLPIRTK